MRSIFNAGEEVSVHKQIANSQWWVMFYYFLVNTFLGMFSMSKFHDVTKIMSVYNVFEDIWARLIYSCTLFYYLVFVILQITEFLYILLLLSIVCLFQVYGSVCVPVRPITTCIVCLFQVYGSVCVPVRPITTCIVCLFQVYGSVCVPVRPITTCIVCLFQVYGSVCVPVRPITTCIVCLFQVYGSVCVPLRPITTCIVCLFQVYGSVCVPLRSVLLLQALQHVGHAADNRILRIHAPHLLRLLSHAGNSLLFCFIKIC